MAEALPVSSYAITYTVTELDRSREEHVVVRRPYESRRTSVREGVTISGTLTNAEGLWHWVGHAGGWQLVDPGRRRAEADARPLSALPPLLEAGLATVEGPDRVAGRPCTRVRTAEPIGSPASIAPTDDDHVELCLDRTGVMLRERWVIDGRTARTQEAAELTLDAPLDEGVFAAVPTASTAGPPDKQLIEPTEEVLRSLDVTFDLPADIATDGAEAWLLTDPLGGIVGGSVHRFFRRGADLAEVEELATDATGARRGVPVSTPVGSGSLHSDLHHLTLQVPMRGGVTLVVRASTLELLDDLVQAMEPSGASGGGTGMPLDPARR